MTIEQISLVANIILTLLLFFQWDRKHTKEQATKNNILATRMMVSRIKDASADNILSSIDATLASLDARSPFVEQSKAVLDDIKQRFQREEKVPLAKLEQEESLINR